MTKEKILSITEKDFEVQTFYSGGPGGQNQNKRNTGVRIIHKPSGAVGESREFRTQLENKKSALRKLSKTIKFKLWLNEVLYELDNKESLEETVNKQMEERNLKIEGRDENGNWVTL